MDAQIWFYENRRDEYAPTACKVDIAILHGQKPCIGGDCEPGFTCKRHDKTVGLVERYLRTKT